MEKLNRIVYIEPDFSISKYRNKLLSTSIEEETTWKTKKKKAKLKNIEWGL